MQPVPGAGGRRCDKAAALAAADTLVELLDTFGVELPEPRSSCRWVCWALPPVWLPTLVTTWMRPLLRFSRLAPRPVPPRTGIWQTPSAISSRTWASPLKIRPRALVSNLSNPRGFPKHPTLPFKPSLAYSSTRRSSFTVILGTWKTRTDRPSHGTLPFNRRA